MALSAAKTNSLYERVVAFWDRFGFTSALFKSLDVVLRKVLRTSVHEVVWLDVESLAATPAPDPKFTFRFLTADEVARYSADPTFFMDPLLADRVRDGRDLCFAALDGDRLAAFGCYMLEANGPEQAAGAAMSYPADVAYMAYGYTHPDYRGARLHAHIMAMPLRELAKRGVTKFVSLVNWTNVASLKSCERLGWTCLGRMITIGGRSHAVGFYPKAAKDLGVKFGSKAARRA
jgi:GNAT superfamily N-acetyltransferase